MKITNIGDWIFKTLISLAAVLMMELYREIKNDIRENAIEAKIGRDKISQSLSDIESSLNSYSGIDSALVNRVQANKTDIERLFHNVERIEDRIR